MFENLNNSFSEIDFDDAFTFSEHFRLKKIPTPSSIPVTKKRKFPGPAGLLPEFNGNRTFDKMADELNATSIQQPEILYSQDNSNFQSGPLLQMCQEFHNTYKLYEKFNIAWIKRKRVRNVPFLAVLITGIHNNESANTLVNLRDLTGEIDGCITNDHLKFKDDLIPGSELVLRDCKILYVGTNGIYVLITSTNVVTIYSPNRNAEKSSHDVKVDQLRNDSNEFIEQINSKAVKSLSLEPKIGDDTTSEVERNVDNSIDKRNLKNKNKLFRNTSSAFIEEDIIAAREEGVTTSQFERKKITEGRVPFEKENKCYHSKFKNSGLIEANPINLISENNTGSLSKFNPTTAFTQTKILKTNNDFLSGHFRMTNNTTCIPTNFKVTSSQLSTKSCCMFEEDIDESLFELPENISDEANNYINKIINKADIGSNSRTDQITDVPLNINTLSNNNFGTDIYARHQQTKGTVMSTVKDTMTNSQGRNLLKSFRFKKNN